mmetsp:Transcript_20071/g.30769  ORF Transcript_20071/g.30769 Transcript_20071/m.30769 type:complete len:253 (-) Transcript_20071:1641-2399(-)|eukprot:CAMPEP_0196807118 /NCGR_PEP_ID=MMETSP1362-20130617/7063_1 /TAXON_ID=163516 /ORGANISM="Leptocylindrus danicus, Strain CCMP1856" /LENGTH=252 /DNA_ID=CAMNT_0042180891 /DNA_START=71 /DNA_END=829 /DNA_ORIENTATION=-
MISPSKSKLSAALTSLDQFNDVLKEKTQAQKEKYGYSVASLKVQMTEMERAFEVEVKRREEMHNALKNECNDHIMNLKDKFEKIIEERTSAMANQLDELTQRVDDLNARFREEEERIPADIENRGKELAAILRGLQDDFLCEKKERLSRESQILKQLNDYEQDVQAKFHQYVKERKELFDQLSSAIDESDRRRNEDKANREISVQKEIEGLHEILSIEIQTRKQEDDDIMSAVNKYMNQLQNSVDKISLGNV